MPHRVYFGDFLDLAHMVDKFTPYDKKTDSPAGKALEGAEVLLASYTVEDYEGHAFVLYRKDGVLFEVNGSHCSCYGLEDQWAPETTTIEALRYRVEKGSSFREAGLEDAMRKVLDLLDPPIRPDTTPLSRRIRARRTS